MFRCQWGEPLSCIRHCTWRMRDRNVIRFSFTVNLVGIHLGIYIRHRIWHKKCSWIDSLIIKCRFWLHFVKLFLAMLFNPRRDDDLIENRISQALGNWYHNSFDAVVRCSYGNEPRGIFMNIFSSLSFSSQISASHDAIQTLSKRRDLFAIQMHFISW